VGCGSSPESQALQVAALAGVVTVQQQALKSAVQNAPPQRTYCGGDYDHDCYTRAWQDDESHGRTMSIAEARQYTLMYINGVRSLNGVGPLVLDPEITQFAQEGSEQLARDHRGHGHITDQGARCAAGKCSENQGGEDGWRGGPVGQQIDEILGDMMAEGAGGGHHDNMLRPEWKRLGVGIVNPGGRLYFTTDFAP